MLLQELLASRLDQFALFHGDKIVCGCGAAFSSTVDIENHLVRAHEQSRHVIQPADLERRLIKLLDSLRSDDGDNKDESVCLQVPEKTVFVLVKHEGVIGQQCGKIACGKCFEFVEGFDELKAHYEDCHPGGWQPEIGVHPRVVDHSNLRQWKKEYKGV